MKKAAFLLALLFPLMSWGQSARQTDYINQYMGMAIQQMQKYKIPASITLAQGLLESAAGPTMRPMSILGYILQPRRAMRTIHSFFAKTLAMPDSLS